MQKWKQTVKLQLFKKKKKLLFSIPDIVVSIIIWYDEIKMKDIYVIVIFNSYPVKSNTVNTFQWRILAFLETGGKLLLWGFGFFFSHWVHQEYDQSWSYFSSPLPRGRGGGWYWPYTCQETSATVGHPLCWPEWDLPGIFLLSVGLLLIWLYFRLVCLDTVKIKNGFIFTKRHQI